MEENKSIWEQNETMTHLETGKQSLFTLGRLERRVTTGWKVREICGRDEARSQILEGKRQRNYSNFTPLLPSNKLKGFYNYQK